MDHFLESFFVKLHKSLQHQFMVIDFSFTFQILGRKIFLFYQTPKLASSHQPQKLWLAFTKELFHNKMVISFEVVES